MHVGISAASGLGRFLPLDGLGEHLLGKAEIAADKASGVLVDVTTDPLPVTTLVGRERLIGPAPPEGLVGTITHQ